jgi:hypothetical protein
MANLLIEAIKIGFTLFEYEPIDGSNCKGREIGQAENIAKVIEEKPISKFLIHFGYEHVNEAILGNKTWDFS